MRPWSIDHARRLIAECAANEGVSLAALSSMIDRPSDYLARFVNEGTPSALRDEERPRLVGFFGIDADMLTAYGPCQSERQRALSAPRARRSRAGDQPLPSLLRQRSLSVRRPCCCRAAMGVSARWTTACGLRWPVLTVRAET
jgi:hypothetical protein